MANTAKKYGRPNEATPAKWQKDYQDFNAPLENGVSVPTKVEKIENEKSAPPTAADTESVDAGAQESPLKQVKSETIKDEEGESKKRKRHEGETPEERAERKRKKKEKKEKRKSKKENSDDGSD